MHLRPQPCQLQRCAHPRFQRLPPQPQTPGRKGHVAEDAHGKQHGRLQYRAHPPPQQAGLHGKNVLSVQIHATLYAAIRRFLAQPVQHRQKRGFSAARWTQNGGNGTGRKTQGKIAQNGLPAYADGQCANRKLRHGQPSPTGYAKPSGAMPISARSAHSRSARPPA